MNSRRYFSSEPVAERRATSAAPNKQVSFRDRFDELIRGRWGQRDPSPNPPTRLEPSATPSRLSGERGQPLQMGKVEERAISSRSIQSQTQPMVEQLERENREAREDARLVKVLQDKMAELSKAKRNLKEQLMQLKETKRTCKRDLENIANRKAQRDKQKEEDKKERLKDSSVGTDNMIGCSPQDEITPMYNYDESVREINRSTLDTQNTTTNNNNNTLNTFNTFNTTTRSVSRNTLLPVSFPPSESPLDISRRDTSIRKDTRSISITNDTTVGEGDNRRNTMDGSITALFNSYKQQARRRTSDSIDATRLDSINEITLDERDRDRSSRKSDDSFLKQLGKFKMGNTGGNTRGQNYGNTNGRRDDDFLARWDNIDRVTSTTELKELRSQNPEDIMNTQIMPTRDFLVLGRDIPSSVPSIDVHGYFKKHIFAQSVFLSGYRQFRLIETGGVGKLLWAKQGEEVPSGGFLVDNILSCYTFERFKKMNVRLDKKYPFPRTDSEFGLVISTEKRTIYIDMERERTLQLWVVSLEILNVFIEV